MEWLGTFLDRGNPSGNQTTTPLLHTSHFSPTVAVAAGSSALFVSSACTSASFAFSDRETTTRSVSPGTTTFTPRWASRSLANSVITAHLERWRKHSGTWTPLHFQWVYHQGNTEQYNGAELHGGGSYVQKRIMFLLCSRSQGRYNKFL